MSDDTVYMGKGDGQGEYSDPIFAERVKFWYSSLPYKEDWERNKPLVDSLWYAARVHRDPIRGGTDTYKGETKNVVYWYFDIFDFPWVDEHGAQVPRIIERRVNDIIYRGDGVVSTQTLIIDAILGHAFQEEEPFSYRESVGKLLAVQVETKYYNSKKGPRMKQMIQRFAPIDIMQQVAAQRPSPAVRSPVDDQAAQAADFVAPQPQSSRVQAPPTSPPYQAPPDLKDFGLDDDVPF